MLDFCTALFPSSLSHLEERTYESIEERRRKAASAVRQLKSRALSMQTSVSAAEAAVSSQKAIVTSLKELYAAHAYLAVSLEKKAIPNAETCVQGAKLLSHAYPDTSFLQREASLLVHGMHKSVRQQKDLAASCAYDIALLAQHLAEAQAYFDVLERQLTLATSDLQSLQGELAAARASYNLLLMPKQWSRYKW